jgi:hypothetical protein
MSQTALSSFIYDSAKAGLGLSVLISGQTVLTSHWSIVGASYLWTLLSNNYVPAENHIYASAFSGAECGAASFTSGFNGTIRKAVLNRVLNFNTTSHQVEYQADSVTWSAVGANNGTAHAFAIILQAGSDGLSPLITYNSLAGFPIVFNGTNLTLAPTTAGVFAGTDATSVI